MKNFTEATRNIKYALYALITSSITILILDGITRYMGVEYSLTQAMLGTMIITGLSMYLYTIIDISKEKSIIDVKGQILSTLMLSGSAVVIAVYSAFANFNRSVISLIAFLVLIMGIISLITFRKHLKENFV